MDIGSPPPYLAGVSGRFCTNRLWHLWDDYIAFAGVWGNLKESQMDIKRRKILL